MTSLETVRTSNFKTLQSQSPTVTEMLESVLFLNDLNKCFVIPVTSCMKILLHHHISVFFKALLGKGECATMNTHKLTDMIGHSMYVWCYVMLV